MFTDYFCCVPQCCFFLFLELPVSATSLYDIDRAGPMRARAPGLAAHDGPSSPSQVSAEGGAKMLFIKSPSQQSGVVSALLRSGCHDSSGARVTFRRKRRSARIGAGVKDKRCATSRWRNVKKREWVEKHLLGFT